MITIRPQLALSLFLALALQHNAGLAQAEVLLVKRATALRDAPAASASTITSLPADTSITRTSERQGGWMQVQTSSGTAGWVSVFDVSPANTTSSTAAGGNTTARASPAGLLRGITGFLTPGGAQARNTTVATSTVGIRGLNAEDLTNAQPNLAAVAQADALRVDAMQAQRFAAEAALAAKTVPSLPAPSVPRFTLEN